MSLSPSRSRSAATRSAGATHAAVVWGLVAVARLLSANLVHSRAGTGAPGHRDQRAGGRQRRDRRCHVRSCVSSSWPPPCQASPEDCSPSTHSSSPDDFPIVLSLQFVVMVAVGGLGNVYGASSAPSPSSTWSTSSASSVPARVATRLGPATTAPTILSLGVFGAILITVMLFFPHGLLPALLDSLRSAWRRGPHIR